MIRNTSRTLLRFTNNRCFTTSRIHDAAALLVDVRNSSKPSSITKIPPPLDPKNIEEGYEIARQVTRTLKWPIAGFKCGATNHQAMVSKSYL